MFSFFSKLFAKPARSKLYGPCWRLAQEVKDLCLKANQEAVILVTTTPSFTENHAVVRVTICGQVFYFDPATKEWNKVLCPEYSVICTGKQIEGEKKDDNSRTE